MMGKNINFSIIIPHYNNVVGLKRLLNSIYTPGYTGEVIVVDDRSNDEVRRVLHDLATAFPQLTIYFNVQNLGPGISRNIGIEKACGKWIIFADADDVFTEKSFELLSKYKNSKSQVVYFRPKFLSNNATDYRFKYQRLVDFYNQNPDKKNELLIRTQYGAPWSKMIKRKLITDFKISFDTGMMFEDSLFGLKVGLLAKKISVSKQEFYHILDTEGSLSKKRDPNYSQNFVNMKVNRFNFQKSILMKDEKKYLKFSRFSMLKSVFATTRSIKLTIEALRKTYS
ncbi:glycosyltransferase family 2 protein [Latilactobacillus curvatus]|uniref:glycosyltransferase family 2 protein n=1 Tax=Latilactobacillus curvatus TaxID=28038 RepID=UPI0038869359